MARALSLLEVLLATALVGFGVLTLMGVFTGGLKLVEQGNNQAVAVDIARAVLDATRDQGYASIPASGSFTGGPAVGGFPPAPYPETTVNNQAYTVAVNCSTRDVHLKAVVAEVRWGTHRVVLERLFSP